MPNTISHCDLRKRLASFSKVRKAEQWSSSVYPHHDLRRYGQYWRRCFLALGREKCILLGHDWGGAIGYYFAGKYPEMVDRYVVVNLPHPLSLARQLTKGWDQKLKSWYMLFFQCPIIPERFLRLGDIQTFESMMKGIQAEDRHQLIEAYKFTFRDRSEKKIWQALSTEE